MCVEPIGEFLFRKLSGGEGEDSFDCLFGCETDAEIVEREEQTREHPRRPFVA
jgi:hypothetical protein